jgi:hypothetical protein
MTSYFIELVKITDRTKGNVNNDLSEDQKKTAILIFVLIYEECCTKRKQTSGDCIIDVSNNK